MLKQVAKARELKFKAKVPCQRQTQKQMHDFIARAFKEKNPHRKLQHEQQSLRLLGFVPPDFNLKRNLTSIYSQRIIGYYEPEKEFFATSTELSNYSDHGIVAHELTHALQDQYFNIDKVLDYGLDNDVLLAHSAVLEGDADIVSKKYQQRPPCLKSSEKYALLEIEKRLKYSVGAEAPAPLELIMDFPYLWGDMFVCRLLKKGGDYKLVNAAIKDLPTNTTSIMHPVRYLKGFKPLDVQPGSEHFQKFAAEYGSPLFDDVIGEYSAFALLAEHLPVYMAARAANGWQGDRMWLFPKKDGQQALYWELHFKDQEQAHEFSDALRKTYSYRFKISPQEGKAGVMWISVREIAEALIEQSGDTVMVSVVGKIAKHAKHSKSNKEDRRH